MRNQRMPAGSAPCEGYQVAEIRRGIDGCRERLRRNRAARRITERATPHTDDFTADESEPALAFAGTEVREEKT